jgi:hypothetical protein
VSYEETVPERNQDEASEGFSYLFGGFCIIASLLSLSKALAGDSV